ncbi:MAG: type IV pilin [Candidatus Heimdallarchaeota archaeon]|nr:type IV pilin [Candidatus Heimdallarchaeota archaeon]
MYKEDIIIFLRSVFNALFPKRKGKRGISPVIATILLIALTVSAAAIVYFVVVPLFQTKAEIVQSKMFTLEDTDDDGSFDQATLTLYNLGTGSTTLVETATVKMQSEQYSWEIQGELEFIAQEEKEITCSTDETDKQIPEFTMFQISIEYSGKEFTTANSYSTYSSSSGGSQPEFIIGNLIERDSSDDPASNFPISGSGYSPVLWFIIGQFKDDQGGLMTDNPEDLIALNGYGAQEDYRPYFGITDEFTEGDISDDTNHAILAYNDSEDGDYPGCITFSGSRFDGGDQLNWDDKGIAYMFAYIYNPTDTAMDVDISIQSDDAFMLWVNGDLISASYSTANWNNWVDSNTITFEPGYNIITVRTADNSGNWDAQVLFWDTGTTDDLTLLQNVWPLELVTSI